MRDLKKLAKILLRDVKKFNFSDKNIKEYYDNHLRKIATKVSIKNNQAFFLDPIMHHDRYADTKYLINQVCSKYKVPDCDFIVILNDAYGSKFPAFSAIRPQKKNTLNIPMPMGNRRGIEYNCATPIEGWDKYIIECIDKETPWKQKKDKAIFRGKLSKQTWANGQYGKVRSKHWSDLTRGKMYKKCKDHINFDIGFTKLENIIEPKLNICDPINFKDQQQYKYMISVGTNADWAERLRVHMFTNTVTMKHEAESFEWFYPLMKPWKHYIPITLDFSDITTSIMWAKYSPEKCIKIIKNANKFANKYIKEDAMVEVMYYLIKGYSQICGRL